MATSELKNALRTFIKQVEAKGSKKDPVRNALNQRTQGYIVNSRVILKEILRPESPFKVQLDRGHITSSEIRGIAREISTDYWRELKTTASKHKTYKVNGTKLPPEFLYSEEIAVGFDDKKRILYYRGKKGDFYTSFSDGIVKPTIRRIQGRTDFSDVTRIYVSPDQKFIDELNKIENEVNAAYTAETGEPAKGTIVQQRRRRARDKFYKGIEGLDTKPWQGIDIGHVFGAKATGAAGLLSDPHDVVHHLNNLTLGANLADLEPELQELVTATIKADIEAVWERVYRQDNVAGKLTLLIPESFVNNRFTGGITGSEAQKKLNIVVRDLAENIYKLEGSPSPEDLLIDLIESHFLDKRKNNKRYKTKAKVSQKITENIAISNIPSKRVKINVKEQQRAGSTKSETDYRTVIDLINNLLHDQIKENMGKGRSKKILNYRTGRFARSAKVKNLLPSSEKGAINAAVKYMRKPYGVFEPGNTAMATPGRNPARIFGRSIRQILQEQKIAKLRRVKVTLSG